MDDSSKLRSDCPGVALAGLRGHIFVGKARQEKDANELLHHS